MLSHVHTHAQCEHPDYEGLMEIYHALDGPNWTNNTIGWKEGAAGTSCDPCQWIYINCTEDRVTLLNLSGVSLKGKIPDIKLEALTILKMRDAVFENSIPDFSHLSELFLFEIIRSEMKGGIPNFQNLNKLGVLSLSDNTLTGEIPDFDQLPLLEVLHIGTNALTGPIPDFQNLNNLQSLAVHQNQLEGEIPDFSSIPKLNNLSVSQNNLSGDIPNFQNLKELVTLNAYGNQLSGAVPDFSNLPAVQLISLHKNVLTGSVPDFSNLQILKQISLYENKLTGSIPNFKLLPELRELFLSDNQLTGNIPDFDKLPNLKRLYLDRNSFSGSIPDFQNFPNLEDLYLNQNNLSGPSLPPNACAIFIRADGNDDLPLGGNISGMCDGFGFLLDQVGAPCGSYTDFFAGTIQDDCSCVIDTCTQAHPDIESLLRLYEATNGDEWQSNFGWAAASRGLACNPCDTIMSYGGWTGVICNEDNRVIGLDLDLTFDSIIVGIQGLGLTGTLPELDLPYLEKLILTGNDISGPLPSFDNMTELTHLGLSFNNFTGPLPTFENNGKLTEFRGSYNELTGTLPDLSSLPQLKTFTASNNFLEGCFNDAVCDIDLFTISDNAAMPWKGDHENYCMGMDEVGAPCVTLDSIPGIIDVDCNCQIVNSISTFTDQDVVLFPNPANDYIDIQTNTSFLTYDIISLDGKILKSDKWESSSINTANLRRGIYLLRLVNTSGEKTLKKFMKI